MDESKASDIEALMVKYFAPEITEHIAPNVLQILDGAGHTMLDGVERQREMLGCR